MNEMQFREVVDSIACHTRWMSDEGGALLPMKPAEPKWFYTMLVIPATTLRELSSWSILLGGCLSILKAKARQHAEMHHEGVPLALDHTLAHLHDFGGALIRDPHSDTAFLLYGYPTQAWADAWDAREKARAEAEATR